VIVLSLIATVLVAVWTIVCSTLSVFVSLIDRSGKSYHWLSKLWSQVLLILYGIRVKVIGRENIDHRRRYVYVSNHVSFMDIPVLLAGINDDIRFTYRSTLTRTPIWGWALRYGHFLMMDRSSPIKAHHTIQRAIKMLHSGASIQLFPEGTRSKTGKLQAFKRGAFNLAFEAKAPIIPVAIRGVHSVMPRDSYIPNWGGTVELRIGEPILAHQVSEVESRAEEQRLMHLAEEKVRELLEKP
jgi:1-acyl-sn-glycerol-3-phosphate acyltransferase